MKDTININKAVTATYGMCHGGSGYNDNNVSGPGVIIRYQ